ncbi:DUF4309 domain-containing protein [Paenibacillus sp. CC-CFT747]|nr:DUF4309 domain-containing protein [Paenibacillus sp. CC-CFT747]
MKQSLPTVILGCIAAVSTAAVIGFVTGWIPVPAPNSSGLSPAKPAVTSPLKNGDNGEAQPGKTTQTLSQTTIDASEAYSTQRPSLMAVTLTQSVEEVTKRYGQPSSEYVMKDETDPITVYEYKDFSVGFNAKKQVQYVELRSDLVDPGLHGFRLGQTAAKAVDALGKPDSDTGYVLTYRTKSTILKLDLDPESKTVHSVKLFARTE